MSSTPGQIIAISVVFLLLPVGAVTLRVWAKSMSRGGLWWDDYLIFLALVNREVRC